MWQKVEILFQSKWDSDVLARRKIVSRFRFNRFPFANFNINNNNMASQLLAQPCVVGKCNCCFQNLFDLTPPSYNLRKDNVRHKQVIWSLAHFVKVKDPCAAVAAHTILLLSKRLVYDVAYTSNAAHAAEKIRCVNRLYRYIIKHGSDLHKVQRNPGVAGGLVTAFNILDNKMLELEEQADVLAEKWGGPTSGAARANHDLAIRCRKVIDDIKLRVYMGEDLLSERMGHGPAAIVRSYLG